MARPHSRPAISDAPMSRSTDTSGRRPLAISLLLSLRPGQWTKNLIVFAGLVFSLKLFEPGAILTSIEAFAVFCALSGIVYLFNDVMDRESDRRHPTKCRRPIAAGDLRSPWLSRRPASSAADHRRGIRAGLAVRAVAAGYLALQRSIQVR
jgi:hypothetical protein